MTGITTSNIAESRVAAGAERGDIFWPGDDRSNVSNRRKGQGGERTPWNAVCECVWEEGDTAGLFKE